MTQLVTYADLLARRLSSPSRSVKTPVWQGTEMEIKVGLIAHRFLSALGEVTDYKTVTCTVSHYQMTVHRNHLTIVHRNQVILQAVYGAATRVLQVISSRLGSTDLKLLQSLFQVMELRQTQVETTRRSLTPVGQTLQQTSQRLQYRVLRGEADTAYNRAPLALDPDADLYVGLSRQPQTTPQNSRQSARSMTASYRSAIA